MAKVSEKNISSKNQADIEKWLQRQQNVESDLDFSPGLATYQLHEPD